MIAFQVNFRIVRRQLHILRLLVVGAFFFLAPASSSAQMAAFRDLTSGWRAPEDHLSIPPTCDKPTSSVADGEPAPSGGSTKPQDVQLTILSTRPAPLEIGNDFIATVRLKNIGSKPVLMPQIPDGEKVVRTSADRTEEEYEVGDITFKLATDTKHSVGVFLTSGGALFANPKDESSYVALQPGSWMELKLSGTVECGVSQCFGGIRPDKRAVMTAWWYQRVLTHKVNGCEEIHGSSDVRQVDSMPFTVEVMNPLNKQSAVAAKF